MPRLVNMGGKCPALTVVSCWPSGKPFEGIKPFARRIRSLTAAMRVDLGIRRSVLLSGTSTLSAPAGRRPPKPTRQNQSHINPRSPAHRNSSREDPPEYASAAWDHWTGRDCAAGRPSRSLCLDLTSGPPLDAPASHSHPTPPSMDTDSCTAPCLNARGVWILTRQGTGSRGTTAPAAPRRWVHRSRRGPPSKTGAPAARVLCAPAWPPSCRCESRIPPQQPYSQVADCQLSRPHHPSRRWRRRAR